MRNFFRISFISTLLLLCLASISFAQDVRRDKPREEKLLNDLKLLIWNQPNSGKVDIRIRIHSGSAFDPKGKSGTIALLTDTLFPEGGIKSFFEEELGGKLEVVTDYDFIQINASARASEFLTALETLAPIVINPTIDKETTAKAKTVRMKVIDELESNPGYIADRQVARNLLGDFPYGRPKEGTKESLTKIDFADLIFAKQRFLASDNATMAVVGPVRSNFVYRAVRRLFGSWQKRTEKIPFSFRLPRDPNLQLKVIPTAAGDVSELRFATKSVSRNDPDYFRDLILSRIFEKRVVQNAKHRVVMHSNRLPSYIGFNFSEWHRGSVRMVGNVVDMPKNYNDELEKLLNQPISITEFSSAKSSVEKALLGKPISDQYFDVETYRLGSLESDLRQLRAVKIEGVRAKANEMKSASFARTLVVSRTESGEHKTDSTTPN